MLTWWEHSFPVCPIPSLKESFSFNINYNVCMDVQSLLWVFPSIYNFLKVWVSILTNTIFPGDSDGKESVFNVKDVGSAPGLGRSSEGAQGNPLQYSCLENPHGQRSQVGYSPQGRKELDTTERLSTSTFLAVARGLSSGSAGLSSCGGRAQLPGGM